MQRFTTRLPTHLATRLATRLPARRPITYGLFREKIETTNSDKAKLAYYTGMLVGGFVVGAFNYGRNSHHRYTHTCLPWSVNDIDL